MTYERSKQARQEESEQGGSFYDLVYRAERPELFFKATPSRVSGPGQPVRVRQDTQWCVPEPELALVLSPSLQLVGYTIGNDMNCAGHRGRESPLPSPGKALRCLLCTGPVHHLDGGHAACRRDWYPPRDRTPRADCLRRPNLGCPDGADL